MKPLSGRNPVFVDPTGRRHRTVRRVGAVLAVPAVGYVVLLVSTLLGGPTVGTPLLPQAGQTHPASRPNPAITPTPPRPGQPSGSVETPGPTTSTPVTVPTPIPGPTATTVPSQTLTPTTSPTTTPSTRPGTPSSTTSHGKPTSAPGRTKTPNRP